MNKHWKVLWRKENGARVFKVCETVAEAKEYRTKLRDKGVTGDIHLISKAWPYGIQKNAGPRPRGYLWCPYCVKWRVFKLLSFRTKEFPTPSEEVLCEVCLIPIQNYNVRKYNHLELEGIKEIQKMIADG